MKTLILLRHAKSSWKDIGSADFDRPLNERGRRAAPFMGRLLRDRGVEPELIISSPAKRARKTAKLFREAGEFDAEIIYEERIYEAAPGTLLQVVTQADNELRSLMLVGHNPGMEGLIQVLTGRIEPMPTAAVAVIEVAADNWADVSSAGARLQMILRPRDEMDHS
ncbi:MAG: histidine phosphatase family protein [Acidobacteria bacterium]|nr:histidine phosphatase family protein [Acidobacteriota bacterium]